MQRQKFVCARNGNIEVSGTHAPIYPNNGNYPATLFGEFYSGHRIGVIMVTGVYASIDLRVPAGVGLFFDQLP